MKCLSLIIFTKILFSNPEELSALIEEFNEKVESEYIEFKRKIYKNYFKRTMIQPVNGNFNETKLFLGILSSVTSLHIEIIVFLITQYLLLQAI